MSQPKAPTIALVVESTPAAAAVYLDGNNIGIKTPARIPEISADRAHTVALHLDGHSPCTKTIEPRPDAVVAELKVQCVLTPVGAAAKP